MSTRMVGNADGVVAEIDIDDTNQRIGTFRLINGNEDGKSARASIRRADGTGPTFSIDSTPAGQTAFVNIPGNAANRIVQTYDPERDRFDGVDVEISVPG